MIKKIINTALKKYKISALCAGMLLSAALPPYFQIWAAFCAFSWALLLCLNINKLRSLAAVGYWFGFGFFAIGFYWIGNALLVDMTKTGWLYPIVLFLNGAFFGLFTILPFVATAINRNIFLKIIDFAAVWFLSTEWLRSFLLTGFPWNPISSIMTFSPTMIQTLAWWGTYGFSMIMIMIFSCGSLWLYNPNRKNLAFVCFFILGTWALLWEYGNFKLTNRPFVSDGNSLVIRLVQPSIPQTLKWNKETVERNLQDYIDMSHGEDNNFVDFVVWGETASSFDLSNDMEHNRRVRKAIPRNGFLITGLLRYEENNNEYKPYNSLAVIDKRGEIFGLYDKSHLVPFGEYIPFRKIMPQWLHPLTNTIAEFGRGNKYATIKLDKYPEFAPLICYEIIFSDEVIRKENKPKWMVLLTNDGWYGISSGPYQHLAAAQMRAVEEGISIVRSANSGISAIINPYGEITAQIPLGIRNTINATIKPSEAQRTLFGEYGNIIPLFMSAMFLLFGLLFKLSSRILKKTV